MTQDMRHQVTTTELADRLRRILAGAPGGTRSVHMLLFGIIFAEELSDGAGAVAEAAGVGYPETINYGRSLAPYVTVNPDELKRLLKL